MRKKTIRCLVLMAALSGMQGASSDEPRCDSHRDELLASITHDREAKHAAVEQEIAATHDQVEQEHLRGVIERAWDEEERLRAMAAHIWRDCVRAARSQQ